MLSSIDWLPLLLLIPLSAAVVTFVWPATGKWACMLALTGNLLAAIGLGEELATNGVVRISVAGWDAPLGIVLYADGFTLLMVAVTAVVGLAVSIYASGYFSAREQKPFWPLWLLLLTALNALFVSRDLFNLYVTLELMGLASATLAALQGGAGALRAAMRYMLAALAGSLIYLLGVAFLYHGASTLDLDQLARALPYNRATWAGFALVTAGLILKTALFPLHFWLPAAHANASAPVSAVLSALVVKASFYVLARIWVALIAPVSPDSANLFALLGVMAVFWGSFQALRQTRIKLLVAYSSVAQLGYLFLAFPLSGSTAWYGVAWLALSHALAKAAMFLATGTMMHFGGHDNIARLDLLVQRVPLTMAAFALAGVSLMGLPPSAGFIGKWLFLQAAIDQRQWGLAMVIVVGGVFTAAYVFKVLGNAFTPAPMPSPPHPVRRRTEWAALILAATTIALGFLAAPVLEMMSVGEPFTVEPPR